jgi:hypothetical protein
MHLRPREDITYGPASRLAVLLGIIEQRFCCLVVLWSRHRPISNPAHTPTIVRLATCDNFLYGFKGAPPAHHGRNGCEQLILH